MKKFYILSLIMISIMSSSLSHAQLQAFSLGARNFQYADTLGGTRNMLFFEIYMYHTNPAVSGPFNYTGGQYGFTFNPAIANGGTLSYRIISSELPVQYRSPTSQVLGDQLKISGPVPVPPGTEISTVFPGVKVIRMRLRTTAMSFANVPLNLKWNVDVFAPLYTTIIGCLRDELFSVEITSNGTFYIDSTGTQPYLHLISPEPLSYHNLSSIQFAWYKYNPAFNYTLQVSDDSLMNHLIVNDSLITDTAKTVSNFNLDSEYFWRIKVRDSLNNILPSLVWRFRTSQFQISPKNDSANTPITLDFKWHKLQENPSHYILKLSYDSLQNSIAFIDSTITDTFKTVSGLLKNKKYYWSLKAVDSLGSTEISAVRSFKTLLPEIFAISPANNSQDLLPDINFTWNKVFDYNAHYTLKISNDSQQTSVVFVDSSITDTFKIYRGLDFDNKYYWSVTVKDSFNVYYKSSVRNFKLIPLLVSPLNNSINRPLSLSLNWRKVFNNSKYSLKLAKDPLLNDIVFFDSTLTDTSKSIGGLDFNTKYYWKVIVKDTNNIYYSSIVWNFRTISSLISPANLSFNVYVSTKFVWHKFFNFSTNYTLKVSTDPSQSLVIFLDSAIADTSREVTGLNFDGKYYWSVSARDSLNNLVRSEVWVFNTSTFLISPLNGDYYYSSLINFKWHKLSNATNYLLEVASDPEFTDILYNNPDLTDSSVTVTVPPYLYLYWRVSARNSSGYFYTSPVWYTHLYWPSPVDLTGFTYSSNRNNVSLNWSTSMEENNSGFHIQRKDADSVAEYNWRNIGFESGHGNSTITQNYSFEDRNLSAGKYKYRLKQTDYNGNYTYYDLSEDVLILIPDKFELSQNYPNPFNPNTTISYQLVADNFVSVKVYDNSGREIRTLVNEFKAAGYYILNFEAKDLASGIYYYRIEAGDFRSVKKMMLLK
ncbi:MAG: T9SS type A sorting domain-containing protein [Ignavibacteria bacterium]